MATRGQERRARHRATRVLALVGVALVAVIVGTVAVVASHGRATPSGSRPAVRQTQHPTSTPAHWDTAADNALASRHMLALPPQAAQPQPLTTASAGRAIVLPRSTDKVDGWIPAGFPRSSNGALAQLAALDENAMNGGDPDTYSHGYRALSLTGAPDPQATGLSSVLVNFRAAGGLPDAGAVPDLSVDYQITEGLIKGTADGGRFAVACVLGELTVQYQARTDSAGVGDCQAMRWTGAGWRISPGVLAAAAPCAWPGSFEAVEAGYREVS